MILMNWHDNELKGLDWAWDKEFGLGCILSIATVHDP